MPAAAAADRGNERAPIRVRIGVAAVPAKGAFKFRHVCADVFDGIPVKLHWNRSIVFQRVNEMRAAPHGTVGAGALSAYVR